VTASMWEELSPEERAFKDKCRRFANEVMRPWVSVCDKENRFPTEVHAVAGEWGLTNVAIPAELGGQGKSLRYLAIGGEELGAVCAPMAFTLGFNHGSLRPVIQSGNSEQKQVFVRDLLAKGGYASLCMTEPEVCGSHLLAIQTLASKTDRGWVLKGTKCMTGVGTMASVFFVWADTEVDGQRRGLSVFAVPRGEGVEVSENPDKLGFRCVPTPTITFNDVEIPDEHLIGEVGEAELILFEALDFMRYGGVPVILGLTVGGLRDVIPWLESREVAPRGRLIGKSNIQMSLGRFYSEVQVVRLLLWRTAALLDQGKAASSECAIAKYKASSLALEATQEFVQMLGWRGLHADWPAQKRLRDARATAIYEGTNEIMLLHAFRDLRRQARSGGDL
jgi:alkylation response protein AidB-like acyl-CoA dehydrogenase